MDVRYKKKLAKKRARRAKTRRERSRRLKIHRRAQIEALKQTTSILSKCEIKQLDPFRNFLTMLYFMLVFFHQPKKPQDDTESSNA